MELISNISNFQFPFDYQNAHTITINNRCKRLSQFLVMLNIPRHHHHHPHSQQQPHSASHSGASSSNQSQQHSPLTPHPTTSITNTTCQLTVPGSSHNNSSSSSSIHTSHSHSNLSHLAVAARNSSEEEYQQFMSGANLPRSSCVSFQSEMLLLDLINGEINEFVERYSML